MASQKHSNENTVIVFHSYPNKPCIDGLMSTILASILYEDTNIALVPYWRTRESFERLRATVNEIGIKSTKIVYVDCTPELDEEIEYLMNILQNVQVHVIDHHPVNEKSPMNKLQNHFNFKLNFDKDNCAALMVYNLLSEKQIKQLDVENLLRVIQYSEYEGMNPEMAGKEKASKIAEIAFSQALSIFTSNTETKTNLKKILDMDMALYFVLDQIMAKQNEWAFFYEPSSDYKEIFNKFKTQSTNFLTKCKSMLNGEDTAIYGEGITNAYLKTMDKLPGIFSTGKMIKGRNIGGTIADIFAVEISIFEFGRTLEPLVRQHMQKINASYAVLMNPPTTKPQSGEMSYYFSLRRINENFNARDLVTFIKEETGTSIGGGHPWASGATLDEKQREVFMNLLL